MNYEEDEYDFPPVEHPVREAITMVIAFVLVIGGCVWWMYLAWRMLGVLG